MYLIPLLVDEEGTNATVITKKNKPIVSSTFGNIRFLDIMLFLGGATSLDSFLKGCKTSERKRFSSFDWFDGVKKLLHQLLAACVELLGQLRSCNPCDIAFSYHQKLLNAK